MRTEQESTPKPTGVPSPNTSAAEDTTRPRQKPAGDYRGFHGLTLPIFGRPLMSAATIGKVHDVEVLLRIVTVRQLLDAYATGHLMPTSGSLDNLASVLKVAAQHQKAADAETRAA